MYDQNQLYKFVQLIYSVLLFNFIPLNNNKLAVLVYFFQYYCRCIHFPSCDEDGNNFWKTVDYNVD